MTAFDERHPYRYCSYCGYRVHLADAVTCDNHNQTAYFCSMPYKGTGHSCYEHHQTWHRHDHPLTTRRREVESPPH